jgi:hypothetical protein
MKVSNIFLGAILLLHGLVFALSEYWFWNYVPDGGPEGNWMRNPALYWLPLLCLVFFWAVADSKRRKSSFSYISLSVVAILFPVGVPYYFLKTYGRRAALLHVFMFAIFASACLACGWIGHSLTHRYYAVWTNG